MTKIALASLKIPLVFSSEGVYGGSGPSQHEQSMLEALQGLEVLLRQHTLTSQKHRLRMREPSMGRFRCEAQMTSTLFLGFQFFLLAL